VGKEVCDDDDDIEDVTDAVDPLFLVFLPFIAELSYVLLERVMCDLKKFLSSLMKMGQESVCFIWKA